MEDISKTTIKTKYDYYEYFVIPFVVTNALEELINLMNYIFAQYLNKFVVLFVNDISIYSKNKEEHA